MEKQNEAEGGPLEFVSASSEHANNALWNYVSMMVWLRTLRRFRGIFSILPVISGGVGSWKILTEANTGSVSLLAAFMAFLAGVIPIIYMATRIEDNILNGARIAGRYRVVEARFRDFLWRCRAMTPNERADLYDRLFEEFLQLKSEAHTVPRWCYRKADSLIKNGEFEPISVAMTRLEK